MSKNPEIVVVGCGYWGRNHVRTLKELGVLAGVADANSERAAEMAAAHDVPVIDLDVAVGGGSHDALVLALPAHLHAPMALRALAAGKHVMVEKPMALDPGGARSVVEAAHDAGLVLMTGHILCFHNAFRTIRSAVAEGHIGAVRHIQSHRLGFGKFHARFDAAWDLAPHDLSMVISLAGAAPNNVSSRCVSVTNSGQADAAHIHMEFAGGVSAHVHVSRHSPYVERRFVVTGEKGMLFWDDAEDWPQKVRLQRHEAYFDGSSWQFSPGAVDFLPCSANMALTDELTHFIDCVRSGKTPLTDGRQGVDVVSILNRASTNGYPQETKKPQA